MALELRTQRMIPVVRAPGDTRPEFHRDYGRIVHSPAFRRLQGKSQVFGAGSGDYYRTRLTHSLEVAQIAREVAACIATDELPQGQPGLVIDPLVVECAALAHDIGHPPFGHNGEEQLDRLLGLARFEGNAQNFRLLMFLERKADPVAMRGLVGLDGLNLTQAVLLAINKYPKQIEAAGKGCYPTEWAGLSGVRAAWGLPDGKATLEAQVMDLCDDIAYSAHDIEDGLRAGKIDPLRFSADEPGFSGLVQAIDAGIQEELDRKGLQARWPVRGRLQTVADFLVEFGREWRHLLLVQRLDASTARREWNSRWVEHLVSRVGILPDGEGWHAVTFVQGGQEDPDLWREVLILKKLAWVSMIKDTPVQRQQVRGRYMIRRLWEAFHEPDVMPEDWRARRNLHPDWSEDRFVADYMAGMTDAYAERVYHELFGGQIGTIYDID